MYQYLASLESIHDGDTMTFHLDLGFSIYSKHSVRLSGVNAPELKTPEGKAALDYVTNWFFVNRGPYVLATRKSSETEKYGRYLASVTATTNGRVLNDDLVSYGHALAYTG